jgi:hypothetical protein
VPVISDFDIGSLSEDNHLILAMNLPSKDTSTNHHFTPYDDDYNPSAFKKDKL